MQPLFFTEEQVKKLLDMEDLLSAMEEALIDFSAGRVNQPLRTVLGVPEQAGWFGLMPAIYRDVIGAKLVTVFPKNAERGLHTHLATIQLFSSETGELLAMLDGRWITAFRTAAVSAVATRELSNPDSRVLAILGSGVQARAHYQALKLVRNFEDVRIWSRNTNHAVRFAGEIGGRSVSAEEAVRGADVVVTVTNAAEPILRGIWLKDGAHVNAVGAVGLKFREVDNVAMQNAVVIVESREAALRESAEIVESGATIHAELGEILGGAKPKPCGRTIIYKSLGIAVEDVAAARLIYTQATGKFTQGN